MGCAKPGSSLATLKGHTGRVRSAAFSPDGKRVVTASRQDGAGVECRDRRRLATLEGHRLCQSAAFSPDGKRVVTAS